MARITVDDCLKKVPNRFQMTLAATYRARQIANGATPMVESDKDKPTVIALREIASGLVDYDVIAEEELIEEEPLFINFEDEANEPL